MLLMPGWHSSVGVSSKMTPPMPFFNRYCAFQTWWKSGRWLLRRRKQREGWNEWRNWALPTSCWMMSFSVRSDFTEVADELEKDLPVQKKGDGYMHHNDCCTPYHHKGCRAYEQAFLAVRRLWYHHLISQNCIPTLYITAIRPTQDPNGISRYLLCLAGGTQLTNVNTHFKSLAKHYSMTPLTATSVQKRGST